MPIDSIEDLRAHVALARKVEMSTIPPYLYAAYSIKDQGSDSRRLILSVVVEEMLHLALTSNLLLALGGEPDFGPDLMPSYPSLLAHHKPDLMLQLSRCTPEVVRDVFMTIEQPAAPMAPPQDDDFESLGQFYAAVEGAIERLAEDGDPFADPQADRQLSDPSFYGVVEFDAEDSGGLMLIDDPASARDALEIIIHQGEGLSDDRWADPAHQELTHYHKFAQLADGSVAIGDTWPVATNPKAADLPEEVRPLADLCNALYAMLFKVMEDLYAPGGDQDAGVGMLYRLMSDGLAAAASALVAMPIGDGVHAGPTFERYQFAEDPAAETVALARAAAAAHPHVDLVDALESLLGS